MAGFSAVFFNGLFRPQTQPARRISGQELSGGWIPYRCAGKPFILTLSPRSDDFKLIMLIALASLPLLLLLREERRRPPPTTATVAADD
jgi:hypothetical protein